MDGIGTFNWTSREIVSLGSHNSSAVSRYFIAFAAGLNYHELDKIQCELLFKPTEFQVHAFRANSTIIVTSDNEDVPDPEPRGLFRSSVLDGLNSVSMVTTSLYTSMLGEALVRNIKNIQAKLSLGGFVNPDSKDVSDATRLAAISDSVTAIADDLLMTLAAAALTYPQASDSTLAIVEHTVVVIGSTIYINAIIAINVILLVMVAVATIWTQFWAQLPIFDYTDLGCMSVGLAVNTARSESKRRRSMVKLMHWNGDPQDKAIGWMVVQLVVEPGQNQLSVSLN